LNPSRSIISSASWCPNRAARAAAERHDVREQARRVEEVLERAASESR
jgi:hypothetical protein